MTSTSDPLAESAAPEGLGFARLSRDSAVFAVGSVTGKVIGVALLPVFTRVMTPDEYGRFDLLSTLGSALISVLLLGMNVAATRLALDPSRPTRARPWLIGSWLAIQFVVVIPPAIVLVVAGPAISRGLFGPGAPEGGVAIVALILIAGTLQYLALTVLRFQQRPLAYTTLSAGTLALNALLAIALLTGWVTDERAPLLAYGISLGAGAAFGLIAIGREWFGQPRVDDMRALLGLGIPLVPAIAATFLAEFANRSVLIGTAGATELGYFSVALRFASVAGLVVAGFHLAWQPRAFALGTSPSALGYIAADARRILIVVGGAVVFSAVISPELVRIVSGAAFGPSLPALGLSLAGVLATGGYLVTSMPSALANRFRDIGASGAAGVGVGFVLNFLLAPRFGSAGTALAVTVGQTVSTVLVWLLGRNTVALPVPWRRTAIVMSVAALISLACTLPTGGAPLVVRAGLLALFAAIAWREGAFDPLAGWLRSRRG